MNPLLFIITKLFFFCISAKEEEIPTTKEERRFLRNKPSPLCYREALLPLRFSKRRRDFSPRRKRRGGSSFSSPLADDGNEEKEEHASPLHRQESPLCQKKDDGEVDRFSFFVVR